MEASEPCAIFHSREERVLIDFHKAVTHMFKTFACNYIPPEQRVTAQMARNFETMQNGFTLWHACRRAWPLQKIEFDAVVSTPRKLCALENILLHIYQVMATDPPDSQTIADELNIGERSFVDEMIQDLVALGALEESLDGPMTITELGCEAHRRGEIPSKTRRQIMPLCFDPIAHEFTDGLLFPDEDVAHAPADNSVIIPLMPEIHAADPNRLRLDTIREVAAQQGLISSDVVVFEAKPAKISANGAPESNADLVGREVVLGVFIDVHGAINIKVYDARSRAAADWFQRVMDNGMQDCSIDITAFLGSLAITPTTTATTRKDPFGKMLVGASSINLSLVPAYMVHQQLLTAVGKAKKNVLVQTRVHNQGRNTTDLTAAIGTTAKRGVLCRLLWSGSEVSGDNLPQHKNIEHRWASTIEYESIIIDEKMALAAMISPLKHPAGNPAASVLTVGKTQASRACRKLVQHFQEQWQLGAEVEAITAVADSQASRNPDNSKQMSEVTT